MGIIGKPNEVANFLAKEEHTKYLQLNMFIGCNNNMLNNKNNEQCHWQMQPKKNESVCTLIILLRKEIIVSE